MNNEEKILQILSQIQEDVSGLKDGQKSLEQGQEVLVQRMDSMDNRIGSIENRMGSIEQRVTKTELLLENTVIPKIEILIEGHAMLNNKVDERLSDIDSMKDDIAALKTTVKFLSAK